MKGYFDIAVGWSRYMCQADHRIAGVVTRVIRRVDVTWHQEEFRLARWVTVSYETMLIFTRLDCIGNRDRWGLVCRQNHTAWIIHTLSFPFISLWSLCFFVILGVAWCVIPSCMMYHPLEKVTISNWTVSKNMDKSIYHIPPQHSRTNPESFVRFYVCTIYIADLYFEL